MLANETHFGIIGRSGNIRVWHNRKRGHCDSLQRGRPLVDLTFTGARGIKVDGAFYRVRFEKGTCDEVFDGCDETKFAFSTQADAQAATEALFDLLLAGALERQTQGLGLDIGIFERDNSISSNDCTGALCTLVTPYDKRPFGSSGLFVADSYRVKLARTSGLNGGFPSPPNYEPRKFWANALFHYFR